MQHINFFRVDAMPVSAVASSVYLVRDTAAASVGTLYMVGTDPTDIRTLEQSSGGGGAVITKATPDIKTSVLGTPGWTATASSVYQSNTAVKAFDPAITTDGWGSGYGDPFGNITYDAGVSQSFIPHVYTLHRYGSQPGGWSANSYSPRDWTVECSNDGVTWDVLGTEVDQLIASDATALQYSLNNPTDTAYRYLKINTTDNNGNTGYCNLTNIDIFNVVEGGSDVEVPIAWRHFTGVLSTTSGGSVTVAHGLDRSKILYTNATVQSTDDVHNEYSGASNKRIAISYNDTDIIVTNGSADDLLGSSFHLVIMYEADSQNSSSVGAPLNPSIQEW